MIFVRLNNIAKELDKNKELIAQTIQKDAQEMLKQRFNDLSRRAQNELIPKLSTDLKKEYIKNEPKIAGHIKSLEQEVRAVTEKRIHKLLEDSVSMAINNLDGTFSKEEIAQLKENIVILADKITEKVMANSADKIVELEPQFDELANKLTEISVNVVDNNISHDLAERQLLAAVIDLLKYEIVPEQGAKAAKE